MLHSSFPPATHVNITDPAKGRKLNYEELEDRMKTFTLPPQWDGPVDYQSMAEAGFVYNGQEDLVYCFSCNIKLDRWSKHMEPLLRHKEESPTCSFVRQKLRAVKGEKGKATSVVAPSKPLNARLTSSIGQLQSSSLVTSKNIHTVVTGLNEPRLPYGGSIDDRPGASLPITPENYQSEKESFAGWPLNEVVHPEQLARVGFVYTGEGALVQCFQCGVKYRHWYKGDVPLNVHQKCNPRCPFLQTFVSESISSLPERQPTRSYIPPESIGSNTEGEAATIHSPQFPNYIKETIRLQSFKHWGGVLPAQELAEGGFYKISYRNFVRFFSCNDWTRSVSVMYGRYNEMYYMAILTSFKSKNASKDPIINAKERIQRIQHSPNCWSDRSKMKVMVWWSTQSIRNDDFVYVRQEHSSDVQLGVWSDGAEPLLKPEEESPASHNRGRKLQAIEGGKRPVAASSKPLEATEQHCKSDDRFGASVLVVGAKGRKKSKASDTVNLPVQTEQNKFSTAFTSDQPQSSADDVQVIPLPYFMNVTRGQGIQSFSSSSAVDQQQPVIRDDATSEERGAIYPPDFDVPSDVPSIPVQPSEGDDRSAIIIDVTNVSMLMKTNFVSSSPLNDTYKSPEASDTSSSVTEYQQQDVQVIENSHKFVCQICCNCGVQTVLLPCGHARTCQTCIKRIMQDTGRCPDCRERVVEILIGVTLHRFV